MNTPTSLKVDLINDCNERCSFCPYYGAEGRVINEGLRLIPKTVLDLPLLTSLFEDIQGMVRRIKFSGQGEATLHPQFREIIALAHSMGFDLKLITNGTTLNRNADDVQAHVRDVSVSVHGVGEVHDRIVGLRGAFNKAMTGLDLLQEGKGALEEVRMAFVITATNLNQVSSIMTLSKEKRIPIIFYLDFLPSLHSPMPLDRFRETIEEIRREGFTVSPNLLVEELIRFMSPGSYVLQPHDCDHVEKELEIDSNGDVYVCRSEVMGNLHQETMRSIIEGTTRRRFLTVIEQETHSECGLDKKLCDRCCYQHPLLK